VRSLALGEGSAEQRIAHVRVHVVPVGGCAAIAATFMLGRIEGVTRQPGHARQPSASDRIANQAGRERTAASFPACTGKHMAYRVVHTTRQLAAQRQIHAAIKHFRDGNFECAITLCSAAETKCQNRVRQRCCVCCNAEAPKCLRLTV
jgi:hypothetical protein